LNELNLELPPAPKPAGVYKPIVISSDMACVSGHGPVQLNITVPVEYYRQIAVIVEIG